MKKNLINKFLISRTVMDDRLRMEQQLKYQGIQTGLFKEPLLMDQQDYYFRIARFINFLDNRVESKNPFNTPGTKEVLFRNFGILNERHWSSYKEFDEAIGYQLSGGRKDVEAEEDYVMVQLALAIIFGTSNDLKEAILLDRFGRVLDGAQRLKAFKGLPGFSFYTVTVDYEHPEDKIAVF